MKFYGLQKTTLLDYPGHIAATIFTGGCNFRCPFCHNMDIVEPDSYNMEPVSEDEILSFLKKRSSVLEGVCITGGEPTLNSDLKEFIEKIKNINTDDSRLLVKLDTNGTNPEMIKRLIDAECIDYIAMDIKSSEDNYSVAAGLGNNDVINKIKESISIITGSGIDYEFRTTVAEGIHDEYCIRGIGRLIKGAKRHYIQSFMESEYVPDKKLSTPDNETINKYVEIMKEYVDEAYVRGVD